MKKVKTRRLTIELGEKSSKALDELCETIDRDKTQLIQNALDLYDFLINEEMAGKEVRLCDPKSDVGEKVALPK